MAEQLTIKAVQAQERWFRASEDRLGWALADSAVTYFGGEYFDLMKTTIRYRRLHRLAPFTIDDAEARAAMYDRLVPRVIMARDILQIKHSALLENWLKVDDVFARNKTLADVLSHDVDYSRAYEYQSEEGAWYGECFGVIQWMRSWIQAEAVDEQE